MAALTSFLWKGVELNNGTVYSIPLADQTLDDPNTADATWAYRKGNTPVQTGVTVKESVFVLNISIVAIHGETPAQYEAKINTLRKIFDTRDTAAYQLQRKLPHEQYYRYLLVAPREMTFNRLERKVSVTFQSADKTWQDATLHTQTAIFFAGAGRTETMTIAYNGLFPVEPVVKVKALTPGSDGPTPLYYREVTVYNGKGAQHIINTPVLVANNWDTTALVSAGKMRSDGLDITVTMPDGTLSPRYIAGTSAVRDVWIRPATWPSQSDSIIAFRSDLGTDPASGQYWGMVEGSTSVNLVFSAGTDDFAASGKIRIGDEIIAYTNKTATPNGSGGWNVTLTGLARGQDGTVAAKHHIYCPIQRPTVLRINYGYAAGFQTAYANDLNQWPQIEYDASDNYYWKQLVNTQQPGRTLFWQPFQDIYSITKRPGESSVGAADPTAINKLALYGAYYSGNPQGARHSLTLYPYAQSSRRITQLRLKLTIQGGTGSYPGVTVSVYRVSDSSQLFKLWSYTHNSASPITVDTGDLDTWLSNYYTARQFLVRLENAAPGGEVRNVRIEEAYYRLDQDYYAPNTPYTTALSAEKGIGAGEYPTNITWRNLSDPQGIPFGIFTTQATNQQVTVDCAEHSVVGMTLQECTYTQTNWLRLVPGTNTLQFVGPQGAGQMQVAVEWRERT